MKRIMIALTTSLALFAPEVRAQTSPPAKPADLDRKAPASDKALEAARINSAKGDYDAAARQLEQFAKEKPDAAGHERVLRAAEAYRKRARWKAAGLKDVSAVHALLGDLIGQSDTDDVVDEHDPRVAELLAALKAGSPEAARFFDGRSVKVSVTGPGVPPEVLSRFRSDVVERLRALGYAADLDTGAETLTLAATTRSLGSLSAVIGPQAGGDMKSFKFSAWGNWTSEKGLVGSLTLSGIAVGLDADLAVSKAAKSAGAKAAVEWIGTFLRASPEPPPTPQP